MDNQLIVDNLDVVDRVIRMYRIHPSRTYPLEEMRADGYLALCKSAKYYEGRNGANFRTMAHSSVRNLLFERSRNLRSRERTQIQGDFETETYDPEDNDEIEKLKVALEKLREDDRRILKLKYYDGLGNEDIARIIGFKYSKNVWKRVDIAVKRLTKKLAKVV